MPEETCLLRRAARLFPKYPGIYAPVPVSYSDLHAMVSNAAKMMRQHLRLGKVHLIHIQGDANDLLELLALFRLGVPVCPVNRRVPQARMDEYRQKLENATADERAATVMFTSGSKGFPKAAVHSYANHVANAAAANKNNALEPGDRWLLSLPLYHVAGTGILFRCLLAGAAMALPMEDCFRGALEQMRLTHLSLVPTQLYRLMKDAESVKRLAKLKAILLGGGHVPEALVRQAMEMNLPIVTSYGMTETCSQIVATKPGESVDALLTAGRPLTRGTVKVDSNGEILVRGDFLFLGYMGANGMEQQLTSDGWFRTGDLGRFDEEGRLIIAGRRDNRFKCGGEIVQPEEVEMALLALHDVAEAVVVPVPDEEYGAVPVAFVRTMSGADADAARILGGVAEALPKYMSPRRLLEWPNEMGQMGKSDRVAMAELAKKR